MDSLVFLRIKSRLLLATAFKMLLYVLAPTPYLRPHLLPLAPLLIGLPSHSYSCSANTPKLISALEPLHWLSLLPKMLDPPILAQLTPYGIQVSNQSHFLCMAFPYHPLFLLTFIYPSHSPRPRR